MINKVAPFVPTTDVAPVADAKLEPAHEPAEPESVEPAPRLNVTHNPPLLSEFHVPVVSPVIVTVFCSHVFAAEIV